MAKRRGLFNFNLLPPKSEQQIVIETERDDSAVYSMLLVFSAAMIYFILFMVNGFAIQPRLDQNNLAIAERETAISSYSRVKATNGELFIKGESLKLVLTKKVDAARIFSVGDAIVEGVAGSYVVEYGRERTGSFVYTILAPNFSDISLFGENVAEDEDVANYYVKESILLADVNMIKIVISVDINA